MEEKKKSMENVAVVERAVQWEDLSKDSVLDGLMDGPVDLKRINVNSLVEKGEEVLGVLNELECRLRVLSLKYGKMAGFIDLKAKYDADSRDEENTLLMEASTIREAGEALLDLHWANIRMRMKITPGYSIGIRDGIKIVQFESKKSRSPIDEIGKILSKKFGGKVDIGFIGPGDGDPNKGGG